MSDLNIDEHLLEEVRHRLTLRDPNFQAVESVVNMMSQHYDVEEEQASFECIVDSATGVGKTYIMAGLIEYLAGLHTPARNFLILTPGRTIRDKTIRNFTPGDVKSITKSMRSDPVVITADNFDSPATAKAIADTSRTKVYIFTVQSLTETTEASGGRKTHLYQEFLGASFYDWLSTLPDLVVLADEHHCCRGPAFSKTITNLNPELVVGVTATPDKNDENLVVYRYPLAQAIEDEYVKIPVLVARQDDRSDDTTKLLDGVTLLKYKERVSDAWAAENGVKPVQPVMLVVAQSIDDAKAYRDILDSSGFDGGEWTNKTLLIHSKLTGDAKEEALAQLDAVEDLGSTVRIIVSIGMLKEGWDVKNVYVIASMRASVSEVLTEQTLGRGMRLPYGTYTGEQMLDTLEILAHEKYEALLKKRQALSQSMVDHRILTQVRTVGGDKKVVRKRVEEVDNPFSDESTPATPIDDRDLSLQEGPVQYVQPLDAHFKQIEERANEVPEEARTHVPILGRERIRIPYVKRVAQARSVSLNQVLDMQPFEDLGKALTHDAGDTLIRTALHAKGGQIKSRKAEHVVEALHLKIPLDSSRKGLVERVMQVNGVEPRKSEVNAAASIVDIVIRSMGDTAAENLSAYFDRAAKRLEAEVAKQLRKDAAAVVFDDQVRITDLDKARTARRRHEPQHTDTFEQQLAYNGWDKGAYEYAWFDSSPEYKAASAIDDDDHVIVWARLHRNDIPITWTQEGREYNPDIVVVEDIDDKRICWLVETKRNSEITSAEVSAKKKAAHTWANTVNNSGQVEGRWQYLLLSEDDVNDAAGSWAQMKDFGH